MSMETGSQAAETHYYCRAIAKERDTYRDLCTELIGALKIFEHSEFLPAHSKLIATGFIAKAESILGDKNGR